MRLVNRNERPPGRFGSKLVLIGLAVFLAVPACAVAQTTQKKKSQTIVPETKATARDSLDLNAQRGKSCGADSKPAISAALKQRGDGFPIISGSNVTFVYRGEAKTVEIAGDFTDWRPKGLQFSGVDGMMAKCFRMSFHKTSRLEYKLIVDGNWIVDPLNPKKISNGVGGENSVLEMPGYEPTKWAGDFDTTLSTGISKIDVNSAKFGKRSVKVYLPSEYFKRGIAPKLPVLYLQDGTEYIERGRALNTLENLIAARKIEPFMIVLIDPVDRRKEYWANDDWAYFMAKELVPAVEKKYFTAIKPGRENRALLGASLGGITSIWAGIKYPEVFSRIGGQSPSFWVDDERVIKQLSKLEKGELELRFYLDDGVYEGSSDSRRVVQMLREKGFQVAYEEGMTGHNWTSWKDRLATAFIKLWK